MGFNLRMKGDDTMSNMLRETEQMLRPYQVDGVKQMEPHSRWMMCDDMGLGKTVSCIVSALQKEEKMTTPSRRRMLVLCGTNAIGVWKQEFMKWAGLESVVYAGTPSKRKKIWKDFEDNYDTINGPRVLITTYAMLKELPKGWLAMFCDEYHQFGIMNHKTQTYQLVEKHAPYVNFMYLMTGTPIRQGVIDLFGPLHLVDPTTFDTYWHFVNKYCIVTQTPFGKQIERNPRNIPKFREFLKSFMVRRLKSEVLKDLPGKQRNAVPLTMTPKQAQAYKQLSEEMVYLGDDDEVIATPNQMTTDLRLRQLLCCPRLLGIDDDGAGLSYLSEVCPDMLRAGKPIVVFTPFRQAVPIIADVIRGWGLGTEIHQLMGAMTPAAFADEWQAFQNPVKKNKALICVIKSSSSFHATEAADCYFLGYEWDFNLNVQAEDRLCRLGQQNFVNCNYFVHDGDTVDENVKMRLNEKQLAADFIIGSEKQFREIMRKVRGTHDRATD